MEIKSIALSNRDFRYVINYLEGGNEKVLKTNEEAGQDFKNAVFTVNAASRAFCHIDDFWSINLKTVKFSTKTNKRNIVNVSLENNTTFPLRQQKLNYGIKEQMDIKGVIPEVDTEREQLLDAIHVLSDEIKKYIAGNKAQQELNLQ